MMLNKKSEIPIYKQLADVLKKELTSGKKKAGDRIDSENELAKKYNISRHTVRQAISVLVNEKVLKKHQGKGTFYRIDTVAKNVDVLLNMSDYYFIPYYMRSISRVLDEFGVNFVAHDMKNSYITFAETIEKIAETASDGVVAQGSSEINYDSEKIKKALSKLDERGIPYVMIDTDYGEYCSRVVFDEERVGVLAGECFRKYGHNLVAAVVEKEDKFSAKRLKGFQKIYPESSVFVFHNEIWKEIVEKIRGGVTAVFCYNDNVARMLLEKLAEIEISVPEDVSVISADNTIMAKIYNITSVSHPKEDMGEYASRALITGKIPQNKIFKPELVERGTVTKAIKKHWF